MNIIFVSYASQDREVAESLREQIRNWGHDTFMAPDDISAGAYWPDALQQSLENSDAVVGILTPSAIDSRNVKNEWDWAIDNRTPLILVKFEDCKLPFHYVSIQNIDRTKQDNGAALKELERALQSPAPITAVERDPYDEYLHTLFNRINKFLAK